MKFGIVHGDEVSRRKGSGGGGLKGGDCLVASTISVTWKCCVGQLRRSKEDGKFLA